MPSKDIVIKVQNISKCYRIGVKDEKNDSFANAMFNYIKAPFRNYTKYRSLYRFDEINQSDSNNFDTNPSDVIWALRNVSFKVEQGELLGIIGRNGAGKSTLLKILTKIIDPTFGRAEIRGRVSSLLEVGTGFHPELTGRENVYLNGTILGMSRSEVKRKFDEIVAFSDIEKFLDTPVKRYSSGMRVRLAFSVAAHLEPEILLVDEVLAVGDLRFQQKCLNKMEEAGKKGRTVLFVSHNLQAINRLCERAILLEDGQITGDGPIKEVMNTYLKSDLGSKAVREWPDPDKAPTGPAARLCAVRVRDEGGLITENIDIDKPFTIEMEYDVLRPGVVLLPHFGFRNEQGQAVFVTVDIDPEWRRRPRPTGHYISTVRIPGNLLAEGMLFVNCHLMTLNPDVKQFSENSAIAFNVVDNFDGNSARGDYARDMPGIVRPLLNWNTQSNFN
jgi:lipopolysaccharide transport system ATP-binding protein